MRVVSHGRGCSFDSAQHALRLVFKHVSRQQLTRQEPAMNLSIAKDGFEIRYPALFARGRALAFPCDDKGRVDLDALTARACANYLFARAMVGRDYGCPLVCSAH
jgi:hypothetical protein